MILPKAVVFDLDGTLAWSKQPVDTAMGERLALLLALTHVAVMSGGGWAQFQKQLLSALPQGTRREHFHLFPTNAGQYWRYDETWRLVYDHSFTPEESANIHSVLNQAMKETGFDTPPEKVWGERIEDRESQISFSGLGQQAPLEEKKKWDPDRKKREPLAALLRERLPECSIGNNATTTIDITRKGITKAYGVGQLAHALACPASDMLYIGDALFPGGNDSVVIPTGIATRAVQNPDETAVAIDELCAL